MTPETRERILEIAERRASHIASLQTQILGLDWCEEHTLLADEVVRLLYADIQAELDPLPPLAVIATGGYGRRELSPYSDIDLTVVPLDESSPNLDGAIRRLFQDLHWAFCTAMRIDVGYAYRLLSDAPGLDANTRSGLIDMRLVAGSNHVFRELYIGHRDTFSEGEFVLAKIRERQENYRRYHDTPYVVEPHLKEGAGGLRCFHCANWIREAVGERSIRPTAAYDRVLSMRNVLHVRTGKHQDLFSRQRQAEIADIYGLDMYAMVSDLVQAGAELHAEFRQAREKLLGSRFRLSEGVLAIQGEVRFAGSADGGESAVGVAIATELGLTVSELPVAKPPSVSGPAALFAIANGEPTLRNLNRCGLLAQILPEVEATKTLIPRDSVHTWTVFEHTLRVIRNLDSIREGTFLGDVRSTLNDLGALYLAALLHDVGKADPSLEHSQAGAAMAAEICHRWGLSENIVDQTVWLVREHLTMARFIRIRDIMNPETIQEFAAIVGDPERLAALTLLTWADVSAVAEGAWTASQDAFLRGLYDRTVARFQGEFRTGDPSKYRQRLLKQLKAKPEDERRLADFIESLPAHYLSSTPPDLVRLHLDFAERAVRGEPSVELFHRADLSMTEITVCALDAPGLLSRLLAVFYAYDLSVGSIRACTTMTEPAVALDVFSVSFGGRPVPTATCKQVSQAIHDILAGHLEADALLEQRGKEPHRQQRVLHHTYIEGSTGILEVRAPRGRGMPYRLSRWIALQGWNIVAARVGQWAGNAAAAFYLQTASGETPSRAEVEAAMGQSYD